jgi:type IV secretory pathway protease TraF
MTRFGLIVTTALAAMGVGYPGLTPMPIKLIWNASASAPIGFYSIDFEDRSKSPIWSPSMHRNRSPPSSPSAAICRRACRC